MSDPLSAIGTVASIGGSLLSGRASKKAAGAQADAANAGIAEQRRQFDKVQELLKPYVSAGKTSLSDLQALLGQKSQAAERAQINEVLRSPTFGESVRQGEVGILSNASATGNLRGGNTQAALAQFRPMMLAQELERRYSRLQGLAGMGQNSAAGVGSAAQAAGNQIASLMGERGAARAGGQLAQAEAYGNLLSLPGKILGGLGGGIGNLF